MSDYFKFKRWAGIKATSNRWYKAIELIAVGKNAATFLVIGGTAPFVGVPYAVKVFRRVSSEESRAAFLEEASFLKELDHPCVMRVVDDGKYHDNPFLVAEYLPQTLEDAIQEGLSLQTKLSYAVQLLSALEYLAARSPPVIHRDLKPANVFVRGKTCILGDFGLKKELWIQDVADGDAVKMSEGPGMPKKFRTPELVRYYNKVENVDLTKSDIFQLGLTLAILFTGENPLVPVEDYGAPIELNKIGKIEAGEVAAGINGLLSKMIQTAPSKRPSAESLVKSWSKVLRSVVDGKLLLQEHVFACGGDRN